MKKALLALGLIAGLTGCARIETGEVGLRQKYDKTIDENELLPGSFNQTLVGSVMTFKVQDVGLDVMDIHPLAADNSSLDDFDVSAVYNINPSAVAELWTKKNKSFHEKVKGGDYLLMAGYVKTLVRNAAYKAVRQYPSLSLADNRAAIEKSMQDEITEILRTEKLDQAITVSQILVRNIAPALAITDSANALVMSQNELKRKEVEVDTAKKEAERIAALSTNAQAIEYINAQANAKIAEGVANGKVQAIVVPYDFKGIVQVGK